MSAEIIPPKSIWMIFEENHAWTTPKRPKFVVEGTREDIDTLIRDINFICSDPMGDAHLVAEPIRLFSSVDHYKACEKAIVESRLRSTLKRRFQSDFLG